MNFEKAIEIADDIYWVSEREKGSLLQTNTFLRRFKGNGKNINYLIDPGPLEFFSTISGKISSVISDVSNVNMYSINHQDPDVGMNATFLSRMNPRSICLCSEDTWRLVRFFEIPKNTYKNVYSFEAKQVSLATNKQEHILEFVPTPYCHFVGAFAVYDRNSGCLFTGDLFGGLNPPGNFDLFATEDHWDGIKMFHEIYMPFNAPVRSAIDRIRRLTPRPKMIVPQHGAILVGGMIDKIFDRLYDLPMGMDLQEEEAPSEDIKSYIDILNKLFHRFKEVAGPDESELLFDFSNKNLELFQLVDMNMQAVHNIRSQPARALELFLAQVSHFYDRQLFNEIRSMAIKETVLHRLPMPMDALYQSAKTEENQQIAEDILV